MQNIKITYDELLRLVRKNVLMTDHAVIQGHPKDYYSLDTPSTCIIGITSKGIIELLRRSEYRSTKGEYLIEVIDA